MVGFFGGILGLIDLLRKRKTDTGKNFETQPNKKDTE
jgi:hypothetical protein